MGRRRLFRFSTGLRYTIDNYRLSDTSVTLGNEAGTVVPVALDEPADKSKLRVTSLGGSADLFVPRPRGICRWP